MELFSKKDCAQISDKIKQNNLVLSDAQLKVHSKVVALYNETENLEGLPNLKNLKAFSKVLNLKMYLFEYKICQKIYEF